MTPIRSNRLDQTCVGALLVSAFDAALSLLVEAAAQAQDPMPPPPSPGGMTIEQTLSDEAQRNTIAFDGWFGREAHARL